MKKFFMALVGCVLTMSLVACNSASEGTTNSDAEEKDVVEGADVDKEVNEDEAIGHHHELPYEWGGSYELEEGTFTLKFNKNVHGDESILIAFIIEDSNISDVEHHAAHMMEEDAPNLNMIAVGDVFEALHEYTYLLALNTEGDSTFTFTISQAGSYRIFTEHHADEFNMQILAEEGNEIMVKNAVEYEGHDHDK